MGIKVQPIGPLRNPMPRRGEYSNRKEDEVAYYTRLYVLERVKLRELRTGINR